MEMSIINTAKDRNYMVLREAQHSSPRRPYQSFEKSVIHEMTARIHTPSSVASLHHSGIDGDYLPKIYYRLGELGGRWIGLEVLAYILSRCDRCYRNIQRWAIYAVAYKDNELWTGSVSSRIWPS